MKKLCLALLAGCIAVPAFCATTVVEQIVARVNNQIITQTEFERSKEQLKQEVQQDNAANADKLYAEREKDVLRDMIDQQLLLEKGKDLGITADTEVIKKLDEMRKQMKLDSMEALEKAAEAQGVSFEDFKQHLREQIISQQVIGHEVSSHMSVSSEEEQKFYNEHKDQLNRPEQVRLSEILVSTENKAAGMDEAQQLAAAKVKADDLLAQLRKGGNFDEIAKKNSQGPSAASGGDLGYFGRGQLAKELDDIVFALKPGDVSDVIRTRQGLIILKVTEHQSAGIPPLAEIKPRVDDAIYMQKLQPALRAYLTKLREDAFIDVKDGYVDTGASPNQTKPVETSDKEAKAKELKKKKKLGIF